MSRKVFWTKKDLPLRVHSKHPFPFFFQSVSLVGQSQKSWKQLTKRVIELEQVASHIELVSGNSKQFKNKISRNVY